jgi:hypothetical protein
MWKLRKSTTMLCEWEMLSHGNRSALVTLLERLYYRSRRENMILVDDGRGRDDDK